MRCICQLDEQCVVSSLATAVRLHVHPFSLHVLRIQHKGEGRPYWTGSLSRDRHDEYWRFQGFPQEDRGEFSHAHMCFRKDECTGCIGRRAWIGGSTRSLLKAVPGTVLRSSGIFFRAEGVYPALPGTKSRSVAGRSGCLSRCGGEWLGQIAPKCSLHDLVCMGRHDCCSPSALIDFRASLVVFSVSLSVSR